MAKIFQINQNSYILENFLKFGCYWVKFWTDYGNVLCYWANFHFCKLPNIEKLILPSGHSGLNGPRPRLPLYIDFFFNGPSSASFSFICVFTNKHYKAYNKYLYVKKCPSIIWCWDSNSQPSEIESTLITTRPGLPPIKLIS